ncbi:MAG: DinB family protein [Bacteroidia bacterium]
MHSLQQQLLRMARYNCWANERIAQAIAEVPAAWLDAEQKSSFTTVRKTTNHIVGGETVWMKRMQGVSLASFPEGEYPEPSAYHQSSRLLLQFLEQQPESFFAGNIVYSTFAGDTFETPACDILQHLFNHGTFHRGQLVTMLRGCGFEGKMPQTDFIAWQRLEVK